MVWDDGEVGHNRRLRPQASLDPEDDSKVGRPRRSRRLRPQASLDPDDGGVGRPRRSRRLRPQASLGPEDDGEVGRPRRSRRLRPQASLDPEDDNKLKQQKSTSVASSCCSSRPTQLIKGGKALENDTLYKEHGGTMSSFFTSGAGTSSGSVSVGGSTKTRKKMSAPEQHRTALAHLISNNIRGAILVEYSAILRFADVLDPFFQFKDFEDQINFLNSYLAAQANGNVPPSM